MNTPSLIVIIALIIVNRHSRAFSPNFYRVIRRMIHDPCDSRYAFYHLHGMMGRNKFSTESSDRPFYCLQGSTFPLTLVVGHEMIKRALLLEAINPRMGGILLEGGHGTCKSVLARALYRLLPPEIERIKHSPYNLDPLGKDGMEDLPDLQSLSTMSEQNFETEFIPTPFVQIPLNVMEDSLVGSIDLEQSMIRGEAVFSPGLLARAHRGVLYIDDINLLDDSVVTILFNVVSEGYVHVEREGLSIKYPCQPIVIATFNAEEGEVRQHLVDRFAVHLSSDETQLTTVERVTVVRNVLNFSGERVDRVVDGVTYSAEDELRQADIEEKKLQQAIVVGRQQLENVIISHDQTLYLCEEATRAGCEGQRAEIFASHIAKANAALDKRTKVNVEDLRLAVTLAIFPRSKFVLQGAPDESDVDQQTREQELQPQRSEPGPSPPSSTPEESENVEDSTSVEVEEDHKDEKSKDDTIEMELPAEFLFGVNAVPIDPDLIKFARSKTKKGKGGKSSILYNLQRGKFVKAIFPKDSNIKSCQLAVAATIRAAAPYQKMRRRRQAIISAGSPTQMKSKRPRVVLIDKSDFRIKKLSKKAGTLVIFVVDASGSMALNRMDAAKGAAIALLSEAYKSRDKICLIAFHGKQAEVIVPITKSIALTKRRLESLPCGGGSPLAHALSTAIRVGMTSIKVKKDVGRVVIVLVTDGRGNIPLCVSLGNPFEPSVDPASVSGMPSKKFLNEEVLMCAKKIGALHDFDMLVIDTEDKFVATGIAKNLAKAALANYYHIEVANLGRVSSLTKETVESFRP